MRFALQHGLIPIHVEDIAQEANVPVRTSSNESSSKPEALAARYAGEWLHAAEALRGCPAGGPLWNAIIAAALAPWQPISRDHTAPDQASTAELRVMSGTPALQREIVSAGLTAGNPLAAAVAARSGTDAAQDLYPRLVAAAVTAATQVAVGAFLQANPPAPLVRLLRKARGQLVAGLPDPSA